MRAWGDDVEKITKNEENAPDKKCPGTVEVIRVKDEGYVCKYCGEGIKTGYFCKNCASLFEQ